MFPIIEDFVDVFVHVFVHLGQSNMLHMGLSLSIAALANGWGRSKGGKEEEGCDDVDE